jgi:hypothetical protein
LDDVVAVAVSLSNLFRKCETSTTVQGCFGHVPDDGGSKRDPYPFISYSPTHPVCVGCYTHPLHLARYSCQVLSV